MESKSTTIPSFFMGHGSPMLAIEEDKYTAFLLKLGQQYQPKAIIIFSAHWEEPVVTISSTDDIYETIYDFGGFPKKLYEVVYPAKGSTKVAAMVRERFNTKEIKSVLDTERGLDHGAWTLLHRMFPAADVPVVQISVNQDLSPEELYKIGDALKGLGEEGYMVIGSGATCHNKSQYRFDAKENDIDSWAAEFDNWLLEKAAAKDLESLFSIETKGPNFRKAAAKGKSEHFIPWLIAMGAGNLENVKMIWQEYRIGNLGYACFEF